MTQEELKQELNRISSFIGSHVEAIADLKGKSKYYVYDVLDAFHDLYCEPCEDEGDEPQ